MAEFVKTHEKHLDNFYSQYEEYSEDQIDSIIDKIGWEYNQKYYEIEDKYNFKSLYTFVDDKLFKEQLEEKERDYWSEFLVEQDFGAILNQDGLVSVEDSIYKFLQNMSVISTLSENLELIISITDENFLDFLDDDRLKIHGFEHENRNSGSCRANRKVYGSTWWPAPNGTRTLKGWLVIRNLPTGAGGASIRYVRAISQAERFTRGRNRRWSTTLGATTTGHIFRNRSPYNCIGFKTSCFSSRVRPNRSRYNSTYLNQSINQLLIFRARAGEVASQHQAPGGILTIILN